MSEITVVPAQPGWAVLGDRECREVIAWQITRYETDNGDEISTRPIFVNMDELDWKIPDAHRCAGPECKYFTTPRIDWDAVARDAR